MTISSNIGGFGYIVPLWSFTPPFAASDTPPLRLIVGTQVTGLDAWNSVFYSSTSYGQRTDGVDFILRDDGSLVLLDNNGNVVYSVWSPSKTYGSALQTSTGAPSLLVNGQTLTSGSSDYCTPTNCIQSTNGLYYLILQSRGNLILLAENGRILWQTGVVSNPNGPYTLSIVSNNLVYKDASSNIIWQTGEPSGDYQKTLDAGIDTDGTVYLQAQGQPGAWLWSMTFGMPSTAAQLPFSDTLYPGYSLVSVPDDSYQYNNTRQSANGQYYLILLNNGNIAIFDSNNANVYTSGTMFFGTAPYHLTMQWDGNLVLYDSTNLSIWSTGTNGVGSNNRLVMDNDHHWKVLDDNNNYHARYPND
eukprot:TRINITY_DN1740_c0_g1_i5.p1 TRINITY_DN1740_c0_g1~~TRINITY_DN1740_c0_g1_i5.p1  ORF type:complete len:360 (-),score=55.71 TRINITY_DN1740_c0_g1_i5:7-1086(-)